MANFSLSSHSYELFDVRLFRQGLLSQVLGFAYLAMKIRKFWMDDQHVPLLIRVLPDRLDNGELRTWLSFEKNAGRNGG